VVASGALVGSGAWVGSVVAPQAARTMLKTKSTAMIENKERFI
jgi:tagatose-1,6-bisphosphate aldolase